MKPLYSRAARPGLLPNVVETDFGYHIIDVTNVKDNTAYQLAVVEREITPSDATINEAFRKAETFAADLSGLSEFEKKAKDQGYAVQEAKNIMAGDRGSERLEMPGRWFNGYSAMHL